VNQHSLPDDGIPVLTDAVPVDALMATPHRSSSALVNTQRLYTLDASADAGFASGNLAEATGSADVSSASQTALDELSSRVQTRVLAGLMTRIDPVVEQRLRESLTDLLEQVLAGMTAELKVTARRIVRDAVAQAVAAELADLHKSGRDPA
jgi:hypothetical protein